MSDCDPTYTVEYYDQGNKLNISSNNLTNIIWGRALDDISKAQVTHSIPSPDCCEELALLEPYRASLVIRRSGVVVWYGVVTDVEYSRTSVSVYASDVLHWLTVRVPKSGYSETVDQSVHFENIWNLAMSGDDPGVTIVTTETGVVQERVYEEDRYRIAWNIIREMLDNGLDVTALGNTVYAGVLENITSPITLTGSDFTGEVIIRKDGGLFANKIYFNAAGDVTGIYPPNGEPLDSVYPLVEEVLSDSELQDAEGAQSSAKARWDFSRVAPRVVQASDALTLNNNLPVDINQFIPAKLITLNISDMCFSERVTYRLGRFDVSVVGSVETITMALQPYGTLESLEDFALLESDFSSIDSLSDVDDALEEFNNSLDNEGLG